MFDVFRACLDGVIYSAGLYWIILNTYVLCMLDVDNLKYKYSVLILHEDYDETELEKPVQRQMTPSWYNCTSELWRKIPFQTQ